MSTAPAGRHLFLIRFLGDGAGVTAIHGSLSVVLGRPDPDLLRHPRGWSALVHPSDRDSLKQQIQMVRTGEISTVRYRVEHGGEVLELEEHLKLLPGLPLRALSVVYNVTEIKHSQDQVRSLRTQLDKSRRLETLGEIAAGVVHDVNGLFTLILNAAELASDASEEGSVAGDLDAIIGAAVRGSALLRGVLDFASGGHETRAVPVDLSAVVRALEPILRRSIGEDVTLAMDFGASAKPVVGLPGEIERILLNMTANACEAMPRGGQLGIAVRDVISQEVIAIDGGRLPPGDYVCLMIADTGEGIAHEVRERLFEGYKSGKGERGRGFGLANVKSIVQGLGGGVQVLSERGEGTQFFVYFPAHSAAVAGAVPPAAMMGVGEGTALLVLPDGNQRAELEERLKARSWRVVPTMTARGALSAYDRARPRIDVVITAAVLPDRTGDELQIALRRRSPDLRILTLETVMLQPDLHLEDGDWYRSVEDLLGALDHEERLRRNG